MRVLHTYEEAYEIGKRYLNTPFLYPDKLYKNLEARLNLFTDPVPNEAKSPIWEMTDEALANTLSYVFHKLHHNCYLLCVKDNTPELYKLESHATAPTFKRAIEKSVSKIDKNTHIDESQRKYIRSFVNEPVRVMQCIVKKYKAHDELGDNEYMRLLKEMVLPNGVFLLNLTDAVILHSKGFEPFPMVTGKKMMEPEFQFKTHIPIMSMSGQKKYSDIPIPNYDDLLFYLGERRDLRDIMFSTEWKDKTIQQAVFRGGSTGCGYTEKTNMRIKLANMESPLIDAMITSKGKTIDTKSIKFDPKFGIGMMNTKIKPSTEFMTMVEQSKYKYIIHVDGNVNAYRLLTTMLTGSLILRVDSEYTSWVDHLLIPNKHYVIVRPDLSDLVEKINWCIKHDNKSAEIARNGLEFARKIFRHGYLKNAFEKIFWEVSPLPPYPSSPEESPSPISGEFSPRSPEEPPTQVSSEFLPRSPEKPPQREELSEKLSEDTPSVQLGDASSDESSSSSKKSFIELPVNAKKCPTGYISHAIKDKNDINYGKKMCKRNTKKKQVVVNRSSSSSSSVVDFPENAKKCPKGFVVFTDKKDGKKKCRRKSEKPK